MSITVSIDGVPDRAKVTREAVRYLVGTEHCEVSVRTTLDLPQSQGFGMSAAGALSTSMAVAKMLGLSRQNAFEATHIAEIRTGCGLGDVSAIHCGGITIRERPGLPPIGKVRRIPGSPKVVLAVVGRKLLTKSVLSDPVKARMINASGSAMVERILERPNLENLMGLSRTFAVESALVSKKLMKAIGVSEEFGMASIAMLGNSVFAIGEVKSLRDALSEFGDVFVCKVDTKGPRIL
jgi:pantoate kinase